jgi:dienelactone hydrolase
MIGTMCAGGRSSQGRESGEGEMMTRVRWTLVVAVTAVVVAIAASGVAQERVTPAAAKGGRRPGNRGDVPESFRTWRRPEWAMPTDLKRWQSEDRGQVRATLVGLLGEMPPRPDPRKVEVIGREERDGYTLERFRFHNGVDMEVPGILMLPHGRTRPAPAIVGLHGHSGSKDQFCPRSEEGQPVGPMLVRRGYVVAAIDAYFNGDRAGKGPGGAAEVKEPSQEHSLVKLDLWLGRTLWGMMVRDEQCLLDYLETRPEVARGQIGATGMSMGCTRAGWLAAVDERVKAIVGVACFTRYTELIEHGDLARHGMYYFVPGMLRHFDTEALFALVAPRPMLQLSGDQDAGAPTDGIAVLEEKLGALYRLYGHPERFRSIIYKDTGHENLPEMKGETLAWFERFLPVSR